MCVLLEGEEVKIRVFLVGGDSVLEIAETLEYSQIRRVSVEGQGMGATVQLHRGDGKIGIPMFRVHHWEEEEEPTS